jgi:hypothetical protein
VSPVRRYLSFENVLVTVVALVVLAGGTAIAASQLAKNSVGSKQLKANAVTAAKIKKNAVTAAKIKAGAVNGKKVKNGSLTSGSLDLADMPFSRIVDKARGSSTVAIGATPTVIPLDNPTYKQAAGEDDFYLGSLEVTFQPGCTPEREVEAYLTIDSADPTKLSQGDLIAVGSVEDKAGGTVTKLLKLGFSEIGGSRFQPDAATGHTLTLVAELDCKTGDGATGSNAMVDVVGVK